MSIEYLHVYRIFYWIRLQLFKLYKSTLQIIDKNIESSKEFYLLFFHFFVFIILFKDNTHYMCRNNNTFRCYVGLSFQKYFENIMRRLRWLYCDNARLYFLFQFDIITTVMFRSQDEASLVSVLFESLATMRGRISSRSAKRNLTIARWKRAEI